MTEKKRIRLIGDKAFYKQVFTVTIPIMIQNLITSFVSLLDNIMVGQVGTESMSGVAIANQLMFIFNLAIFGALSGIGIFTAQFFGAKDEDGIRHTFRAKWYICLFLFVAFIGMALWKGEFLISLFLQAGDDPAAVEKTLSEGMRYMRVMLIGLLPFCVSQVYSSTLRESGETRLPMIAGVVAVLVNLLFNYILIFGHFGAPALGVAGAAVATVIARFVEMAINVTAVHKNAGRFSFIRGAYRSFYVPGPLVKQMTLRGLPLLLNEFLWAVAMSAVQQSYSTRGLVAVAAMNISGTVSNLFNQAVFAMGSAVAILVGQLLGAGKFEEARERDYQLITFSLMLSLGTGILSALFAPLFPQLYNTQAEVRALATSLLRINAMFMPLFAFVHCCYFTLRSGGKTVVTFFFDSFYMIVLVYPVSFILSRYTSMNMELLYTCMTAVDIVKAVVGFILVKKGVWINNLVSDQKA